MTPKERAVMQQALEALEACVEKFYAMKSTGVIGALPMQAVKAAQAITALREVLEQHKPHEECECNACLKYFTDKAHEEALAISCHGCDYCNNHLFAGTKCNNCGRKALAEQAEPNSTFMEGYRSGLAEMREKCATVSEQGTGEAVQKTALELLLNERKRIAAAIRAIKFEGDTGFRPVSEMVAEHKQAEQSQLADATLEPVAEVHNTDTPSNWSIIKPGLPAGTKLYAAPVRTKDNCNHLQDLTDEEIVSVLEYYDHEWDETTFSIAHAAIKKFKEKNK